MFGKDNPLRHSRPTAGLPVSPSVVGSTVHFLSFTIAHKFARMETNYLTILYIVSARG